MTQSMFDIRRVKMSGNYSFPSHPPVQDVEFLYNITTGANGTEESYPELYSNSDAPEEQEPFEFAVGFRIASYILYNLVFVCGLLGNLLVYYTIHHTHPRMKTVQNYFLGNLALGDLLTVVLCVPTGYIEILWQYWPFGKVLCHLLLPVKAVGVFVSAYTLVALAIDRYRAIIHPLKPGWTRTHAKMTLVGVWIAAFITAIPVAIYAKLEFHEGVNLPRCSEYGWESPGKQLTYNLALLFLQYIWPVCVLIYTYIRISLVVWGKRVLHTNSPNPRPSKGKRKTVILSLSVVLGYTLAWIPYNIVYMIYQHGPLWILDLEMFPYLFLTCHFLAMSHTTFNPVIYFWINSKFRLAFSQVMSSKCPCLSKYLKVNPGGWNKGPSWRSSSHQKSLGLNQQGGGGGQKRNSSLLTTSNIRIDIDNKVRVST